MSSIGSGPGLGTGHIELSGVRPITGAEARATTATPTPQQPNAAAASPNEPALVATTAPQAGAMPVDTERVIEIRKAIESGTYPVLPTKISDAMIAAGLLLQVRN